MQSHLLDNLLGDDHRRLLDGIVSLNGCFDVTQFHPVASHLHLPVDAAEYLNLVVDKIATQIT